MIAGQIHLRAGALAGPIAAAAVLAIAMAVLLYRRETALSPGRRVFAGAMRAIIILALLAVLLEPIRVISRSVIVPANLLVLTDVSESMAIEDPRRRPEDIRDAALARGELRFREPELHAALARAARTFEAPSPEAREALDAARAAARAAGAGALQSREDVEALLAALREPSGDPVAQPAPSRRIDIARAILAHPDLGFLRIPGDAVHVRHFRFGETLMPAEGEIEPDMVGHFEPTEKATALGSALEEAASRFGGQTIAGIVLLTDGASNLGLDPLEAARRLAERSIPIFPVGIGIPSPDDIAVRNIVAGDAALAGERVSLRAEVASSGFRGRDLDVAASLDGAEVARKTVVLDGPQTIVDLEFTAPSRGGSAVLDVTAGPLSGEVTTENNRFSRRIEIIDDQIKVLDVEGKPRWEYRYLRAVLLRDPRLDVQFLLTEGDADLPRTSPQHLARFPEAAGDAARYDLVILGNVPARFFTPSQLSWLADLVRKHGGSFLLLAGEHAPAGYAGTPLADILPVEVSVSALEAVEPSAHPVPTEAGLRSGVMVLDDAGRSEALWSGVRPLHRLPPLAGPKPGAVVLATLSGNRPGEPYPVMAWQRAGTGRSLFVATDSLWRLRYGRGDLHHARFWGQAIRFLTLSRLLGENRRVRIEVASREVHAGERVEVHATVLDETFEPSRLPSFTIEATASHFAGSQALALERVPGSPGLFSGVFVPDREGTFTLRPAGEGRDVARPLEIVATAASREALDPDLKDDLLRSVAEISGGRTFEVPDLPALAASLPQEPATRIVKEERELWDHWAVLVIVLIAGGGEWLVRRRHDLP